MMSIIIFVFASQSGAFVERKNGRVYIIDRTGERWDVTQAESVGFQAGGFEFGIGKHAFTPLDDADVKPKPSSAFRNPRVIGVTSPSDTHAYSVKKLRHHEIANTFLGDVPITAGY